MNLYCLIIINHLRFKISIFSKYKCTKKNRHHTIKNIGYLNPFYILNSSIILSRVCSCFLFFVTRKYQITNKKQEMTSIKKQRILSNWDKKKLKHGNTSLYLDIYYKGIRSYEFLNLYLTKANTPEEREKNQQTLQLALSIKAKRQIEIQNNQYGFHSNTLSKEQQLDNPPTPFSM